MDAESDLSLYIHLPFCREKCSYCAFYSVTETESSDRYFDALLAELSLVVARRRRPFSTIFLGGGNPGILSVSRLRSILELITRTGKPTELTMEINPESLGEEHGLLATSGLSRISIGIQSLKQKHLGTLGRQVSRETNVRALHDARIIRDRTGVQVNCDLMTCIPGQTVEEAIADIDELVHVASPDHISLYNLTVEEGTRLASVIQEGSVVVPDEDEQAQMLRSCWDHLREIGYEQYEISNFSTSRETRCRHNERYWRLQDYLGIGPGAAGTITVDAKVVRPTGASDLQADIDSPPFSIYDIEELDRLAVMEELLLVGLRTSDGIDKRVWNARLQTDFDAMFKPVVTSIVNEGTELVRDTPLRFSLAPKGMMLCDAIIMRLAAVADTPT